MLKLSAAYRGKRFSDIHWNYSIYMYSQCMKGKRYIISVYREYFCIGHRKNASLKWCVFSMSYAEIFPIYRYNIPFTLHTLTIHVNGVIPVNIRKSFTPISRWQFKHLCIYMYFYMTWVAVCISSLGLYRLTI